MEPVDFSVLEQFRDMLGDDGAGEVRELIALYLEDAPNQMALLKSSLDSGDKDTFRRAAHSFKSSNANIGAFPLQMLCQKLETLATEDRLTEVSPLLSNAEQLFSETSSALGRWN